MLDLGKKIPKKIAKKFKKIKKPHSGIILTKMGWDRPRKREKKFSLEFRSYSARERKFQKKSKKKLKN